VDAKDEQAAAFYRHHGFLALQSDPLTLFLPLQLRRALPVVERASLAAWMRSAGLSQRSRAVHTVPWLALGAVHEGRYERQILAAHLSRFRPNRASPQGETEPCPPHASVCTLVHQADCH
jgi:hypothetical protein